MYDIIQFKEITMKFKFAFGKFQLALLIIVLILSLAAIIVNSLFIAGVGILKTYAPAIAGTSIACSALIFIFALLVLFNSYYKISDGRITMVLGFLPSKIDVSTVTDIKKDAVKNDIYILYGGQSLKVIIKEKDGDIFVDELRKQNPAIIFSYFNIPDDKKEDGEDKNK